jgi:hypothetical protein
MYMVNDIDGFIKFFNKKWKYKLYI